MLTFIQLWKTIRDHYNLIELSLRPTLSSFYLDVALGDRLVR